jgi:succinate dehydrogenase/fumarate reductase flavoprotein subunit
VDAYTIPQAARAAGLSPREVRLRIEEGDVRAFVRAGRRMVERAELERLVERQEPELPALAPVPDPAEVRRLEQELAEARRELRRARERIEELEAAHKRPALTALFQSTEPDD